MAVSDGETITVVKDMGLVTTVFDERTLSGLHGPPGHRPHPVLDPRQLGLDQRPAGLPAGRPGRLRARPQRQPDQHRRRWPSGPGCCPGIVASDSDVVAELLAPAFPAAARAPPSHGELRRGHRAGPARPRGGLLLRAPRRHPPLRGARPARLPAAVPRPARPGGAPRGLGAGLGVAGPRRHRRDLRPRARAGRDGDDRRRRRARPTPLFAPDEVADRLCIFEFVYFARPDTRLYGSEVHGARRRMGELLGRAGPGRGRPGDGRARLGVPAAEGYARRVRHPLRPGPGEEPLHRPDLHRPRPQARASAVRRKLNPLRENIAGKRLVVVDDSIVRGTTTRAIVGMLRDAGATEVHLRISSPAVPLALLLRHRHPDPRRAAGRQHERRRDRSSSSASTRSPTSRLDNLKAAIDARRGRVLRRLPDRRVPGAGPGHRSRRAAGTRPDERRPAGRACPGSERDARPPTAGPAATYAAAGVDIDAGETAVDRIARIVASTARPGVVSGIGGLRRALRARHRPLPAPGPRVQRPTGSGPSSLVAQAVDRYDTVGIDLVAMCVDDLVCVGAEPLFLLDYVAVGRLDPDRVAELVGGHRRRLPAGRLRAARRRDGRAPRGHGRGRPRPGRLRGRRGRAGRASSAPHRVRPGDVLVGLLSPGLRSNGYTLARHVLLERAGRSPGRGPAWPGADRTLGRRAPRALGASTPRRCWRALAAAGGGCTPPPTSPAAGIAGNLARVLPDGRRRGRRRGRWAVPRIFAEIARARRDRGRRDGAGLQPRGRDGARGRAGPRRGRRAERSLDRGGRRRRWSARSSTGDRGGPVAVTRSSLTPRPTAPRCGTTCSSTRCAGATSCSSRAKTSSWFIDSKQTVCRPEAMLLVADAVLSLVPEDATAIGGLTMGADPVAFVTAAVAADPGSAAEGVQRPQGGQGPRRRRPDRRRRSTRATGSSSPRTPSPGAPRCSRRPGAVRAAGAEPVLLVAVVDRGGTVAEMAAAEGLRFEAVFGAPDLGFPYELGG